MKFFSWVHVVWIGTAIALFAIFSLWSKIDYNTEITCAIACQSKDVVVRDGKCGCITWRENK